MFLTIFIDNPKCKLHSNIFAHTSYYTIQNYEKTVFINEQFLAWYTSTATKTHKAMFIL